MLDPCFRSGTMSFDAGRGGRASGEAVMARPRYQQGSLVVRGKRRKVWFLRWREDVLQPDGTVRRIQRAETLGPISQITRQNARGVLQERVGAASRSQRRPEAIMTLEEFVRVKWRPNAELALKRSSVRYYSFQLKRHILPALGSMSLCDINRSQIEMCLSNLRQKGYAGGTLRGVRATFSAVLRAAVERDYIEDNPAHGIRIKNARPRHDPRFYSPAQICQLLAELTEPCRTVVLLAVLTGMRIGEILALRWKRVDLFRGTLEIAETYSDGQFGSPKTRSSNRVIPISGVLSKVLQTHHTAAVRATVDELVFCTPKGTPLSPQNLYNRTLAPACDRIKQPRISWHSFRHTHATLLGEVGESVKTAQALLGHSDLQTTLNTYMHVIPESQRRAVDRVAGVLFSDVLKLEEKRETAER